MVGILMNLQLNLKSMFLLLIGIAIGKFCFLILCNTRTRKEMRHIDYTTDMSEKLFNEVKVLCMIMTNPSTHRTKAVHIKSTWGRRCNKLLFITSQATDELDTIVLPIKHESRNALRNKTKGGFLYAHKHYINDFDFFLKADDDNFIIMENLRYMLYQHRPQTALFFGHRFALKQHNMEEGFMAGGGYILSKKALKKFAQKVENDKTLFSPDGPYEDVRMGKALAHSAIFVDSRDDFLQERFFPLPVTKFFKSSISKDPHYWFNLFNYYSLLKGGLSCCSDVPISFHYIKPPELYYLEYLIYHVHPFGLVENFSRSFPRTLSLKEIVLASDVKSSAPNFIPHVDFHNMTSSEIF